MGLSGKNVVFVGGLGSIGFEASKALATKNFANLVILDAIENPKGVQELKTVNRNVTYIKLDITNKDSIKKAISETVAKVKYIDVLINGAGIMADRNVELTININLIGLINTTLEALPYMDKNKQGRGGAIVNISSVLGLEPCGPCITYCASKFGVMGFTRSLADPHYYNLTGVAAITFCPGLTETPLKNHIADRAAFDYSQPIADKMMTIKTQTTAACGDHLAQVCETFKNGAIFISDLGTLREVEPKVYWVPKYT